MKLTVHLELENPTAEPQTIVFEKGRCFEVASPSAGLQNAVLAKTSKIVVPPKGTVEVDLKAYCLNEFRDMTPVHHTAFATPFMFTKKYENQDEVWAWMKRPAA
ncbi:MAG: hypothetical protein P9L94_18600 [Candidatus Hinthialibacter antarcticus]|nr:hypothetical protein [Candidatus Hinthialibacter antarcticus]